MTRAILCAVPAVLLMTICTAAAQVPPFNRPAAGERLAAAASVQREYGLMKANLIYAAEQMSEADYAFRPNPDMRSFGELIGHAANSQFNECAHLVGKPNPSQAINYEKTTAKAPLVTAVTLALTFCDQALSSLTDATMIEVIHMGEGTMTRLGYTVHMITHGAEVNGLATVYLRMKGLTPRLTEEGMGSRKPEVLAACASSTVSGTVTAANPANGEMTLVTDDKRTLNLRADLNTVFHVPNARPEDLRPAALAKALLNAAVRVNYCTTELWVREVTISR